ncbi:MauE/DoxX family redox-associated membrane protein [Sandarakinorhabdus sp.]|uniref:MauE/DoxX family redox-associated membrane protein n=1 Tax=Sandarakinorhabdus sp. TaxID=1916663 RepID=UPI003F70F7BF
MDAQLPRTARLVRMALPDHVCPWGLRARHLLQSKGYEFEDVLLTSREATDAFKDEHGVKTTPQVWIAGQRVGGHDDLRRWLGLKVHDPKALTYRPVIALFAMAAAIALAISMAAFGTPFTGQAAIWFIATAMCLLAFLKLKDIEGFVTGFVGYDLLARAWLPYAYVYAWAEAAAGVLMLSGQLVWLASAIALFIGGVGAVSVIKSVYIDKRELTCACVGAGSNVPLGFVSLLENLMMLGMAVFMLMMRYA